MLWKRETRHPSANGALTHDAEQTVQCPLCGTRFDPRDSQACSHCPRLFRGCGMAACPRCFHEFPVFP